VSFARAEYFYDTEHAWDEVREEALWNMRWRARLRRFRPPGAGARPETSALLALVPASLASPFAESRSARCVLFGAPGCAWEAIH
jgi:hypothetical protein